MGVLEAMADDVWLVSGDTVTGMGGFAYPTRAALIRLPDGRLWVWSPVGLTSPLREAVDALGPVAHIVAPNGLHHLALADWHAAYPDARIHGAPGLADKRPDIPFAGELGDQPDPDWGGVIEPVAVRGNAITTEIVFFHRPSGTVFFTDLIQHLPANWYSGWRKWIARWDAMTAPAPAVPRKFRLAFTDRKKARTAISQILDWPIQTLVFAHGEPVTLDAKACVAEAFAWLR